MAYVAVIIVVLVGFVGLAVDFGRLYTTNSQAQDAADASALAAASQLDGQAGAIARAKLAAMGAPLVNNTQEFAGAGGTVPIAQLRFLHSLPPNDTDPITDKYETFEDSEAIFVEATTDVLTQTNPFLAAVGAGSSDTWAVAVAGYKQALCQFPPIMICNPYETQPAGGEPFLVEPFKEVTLLLKALGPDSNWEAGVMGLLSPPDYDFDTITASGAKKVAIEIARVAPPHCFTSPVNIQTGAVNSMRNALNVRLDIYENPFFGGGKAQKDPMFRPSKDVTKGYNNVVEFVPILDADGNPVLDPNGDPTFNRTCDSTEVSETDMTVMGMPPDECFRNPDTGEFLDPADCGAASIAPVKDGIMTKRFGSGEWARNDYWTVNHPEIDVSARPIGWENWSRFQTYRWEVDQPLIPDNTGIGGEDGNPQCYNSPTAPSDLPDRRLIYMAVINCVELGITGNSVKNIPVEKFVKMFLIRPVSSKADTDIWLEFVDVVKPGADDGFLHEMVQLYR